MAHTIRLRRWQRSALETFQERRGADFLAVATPGAGKTTFALAAARQHLGEHPRRRVVVVAPTQHLKTQWADAAEALDLHLEPGWSAADGRLPADMHGMVTTYQQVAASTGALAEIARDAFVVLDEAHHSGEERAWGDSVRAAFSGSAVRLSLSGTPFRSDTRAIPFVLYDDDGLARADIEYGYGDALSDGGVVRPVRFPRTDGQMEWIGSDGQYATASFQDALDPIATAQRLRTALSPEGDWLPDVLRRAHERLLAIRRNHPGAGGMVIAIDQEHARAIADLLRRRVGVVPTLVTLRGRGLVGAHRRVRPWHGPLDRRGADALGGRQHPPPARRGVRHDHHHRALLPAGRRPPGAVDAWPRAPAEPHVHPRRPAPAGPCPGHRAAEAPQPATGRDRTRPRRVRRAGRARGARTGRRSALAVRGHLGRAASAHRPPIRTISRRRPWPRGERRTC